MLDRAPASASYTPPTGGGTILGLVNGPIEVPRREKQRPEEATLEVIVKPEVRAAGGVAERHVEALLRGVLSRVVLTREKSMARRAVVLTLVVMGDQVNDAVVEERGGSYLPILPSLLNAALLALLSAAIPMSMTYASTAIAVSATGDLLQNPSATDSKTAKSIHALAFSSTGHLVLNESAGAFDLATWEKVYDLAESTCLGGAPDATKTAAHDGGDVNMDTGDGLATESLLQIVRNTVEDRLREDCAWKLIDT